MSKVYTERFARLVNSADTSKIGVQLGNLCIEHDIPVKDVAEHFDVTTTTVCNWFKGLSNVQPVHQGKVAEAVEALLKKRK